MSSNGDYDSRQRRTRRGLEAATVGLLVAVLVMLVLTLFAQYSTSQANRKTLLRLTECTTPPHQRHPRPEKPEPDDCWVQSQRRTADVLGEPRGPINTVVVIATACAVRHDGDQEDTLRCTQAALDDTLGGR